MNTRHTHQAYPVYPTGRRPLGRRQARLRRLLGILLIVVGSVWFCLRLTGLVGDLSSPFDTAGFVLSVPQAVCGMLIAYSIGRAR